MYFLLQYNEKCTFKILMKQNIKNYSVNVRYDTAKINCIQVAIICLNTHSGIQTDFHLFNKLKYAVEQINHSRISRLVIQLCFLRAFFIQIIQIWTNNLRQLDTFLRNNWSYLQIHNRLSRCILFLFEGNIHLRFLSRHIVRISNAE